MPQSLYWQNPQYSLTAQQLTSPQILFSTPPTPSKQNQSFNQVSSLLNRQDIWKPSPIAPASPPPVLLPLFKDTQLTSNRQTQPLALGALNRQTQIQQKIINSGLQEWKQGVRETHGSNKSPRINQYAQNSKFGPGYEWCGFFTAWNYSQAGFKYPENFASYQKARDFFLYRSYTSRSPSLHQQLDQLRQSQTAAGTPRQYFMMEGSPTFDYVKAYKSYYSHLDLKAMTYNWQNIPIQPGDVALFSHGHVGLVISYDSKTGKLETVEGNTSGKGPDGKTWSQAVVRKTYDLSKTSDRNRFDGFGRASQQDFKA